MSLKTYTRYALQMAVPDDAICRREPERNRIGSNTITFPPETKSLPDRYHLFLNMNRKKSRYSIRASSAWMEQRLQESEDLRNIPKTNLDIAFTPYDATEEQTEEP